MDIKSNFNKTVLLLVSGLLTTPFVWGAIQTNGYWTAAPNPFWPDNTFVAMGTFNQQYLANSNPDIYCKLQGDEWRMPAIGEINTQYRQTKPFNTVPYHFSAYSNANSSTGDLMANVTGRFVGGFFNEWGNLSAFTGSGWEAKNYWVAEPLNANYRNAISASTGAQITNATGLQNVVCITDLKIE